MFISFTMSANSGIPWIDYTFDYCVKLLIDLAHSMGITYEETNVWIFCIIWPIFSFVMIAEIVRLKLKLKSINENNNNKP